MTPHLPSDDEHAVEATTSAPQRLARRNLACRCSNAYWRPEPGALRAPLKPPSWSASATGKKPDDLIRNFTPGSGKGGASGGLYT